MKKIIKKFLPKDLIWHIVDKKSRFEILKIRIFKSNKFFVLLNLIFQKNYINEHDSFLQGAYKYENSVRLNQSNSFFLRRNIHRIEKGMLMRPRREVFALRFILPTIKSFKALVENTSSSVNQRSELLWSKDVLNEYFRIVKSKHNNYSEAYKLFHEIVFQEGNGINEGEKKIPFLLTPNNFICYNDFFNLNKKRKSVRWFKDIYIPDEIFNKALRIASLSPSSCNRLPFRYIVSNKDKDFTLKLATISQGTVGWGDNIPSIVVLVGKQRAFSHTPNRHSIYVDSCLSVMPFVLALETLGLNSCIINWADIPAREKKMNNLLSLDRDEKVILSIAVGYGEASSKVAFSQRKDTCEISTFI